MDHIPALARSTFPAVEIKSHREALGLALTRRSEAERDRRSAVRVLKYVAPVALAALLLLSVFLVVDLDGRPTGRATIDLERDRSIDASITLGPGATGDYQGLYSTVLPVRLAHEPAATFESLEEAEKVARMKTMRPGKSFKGRVEKVVIGAYLNQEPMIFITYDNGLEMTAAVWREPIDWAGRIESLRRNESQMNARKLVYQQPSYGLVDVRGSQGFTWGKDVSFWEKGIEYQLRSRDGALDLESLVHIADSMRGDTAVPTPGTKVLLPPSYPDVASARRMSGIDFRVPADTGAGTVTGVYATTVNSYQTGEGDGNRKNDGKLVLITYSNGLSVSYESPMQSLDGGWVTVRELEIGGCPARVVAPERDDGDTSSPDINALVLKWKDGECWYSVAFDSPRDEQAEKLSRNLETQVAALRRIARSMYR